MNSADTRLLLEAQDQVEQKYPGTRLESVIQGCAYLGEFERGITTYGALGAPSAADDRWLGVCFFQVFEDMRAQEAFYRALAKGEEAARVNLAHLLRFLERSEEAATELLRVDVTKLRPYDEVLFLRVSSLHEETNGNIRKAVNHAELAWEKVQGLPEYQILAPSVLAQLGILYGRMGEARRALWYFDKGIKLTSGLEQQKVQLRRATLLLNLGRFAEVEAALNSLVGLPEGLSLESSLLRGELQWARGEIESCIETFYSVVDTATRLASGSDEFTARLALAALATQNRNFTEASEHLADARILISDRSDILVHRFREIILLLESGQYGTQEATSELEMLAVEFRNLGTLQEEACVRLHLAEVNRGLSAESVADQLAAVKAICKTVHNTAFLCREWILVPDLFSLVARSHPELVALTDQRLEVLTVGDERLLLNGTPIRVPMKRFVEMVAYFLEFDEAPLGRVLRDLFPAVKTRTGRSYFHQFRHQLRKHVPGVQVVYNQAKKIYELKYDIEIVWDVEVLRQGDSQKVTGAFLPSATSSWARRINEELSLRQNLRNESVPAT